MLIRFSRTAVNSWSDGGGVQCQGWGRKNADYMVGVLFLSRILLHWNLGTKVWGNVSDKSCYDGEFENE